MLWFSWCLPDPFTPGIFLRIRHLDDEYNDGNAGEYETRGLWYIAVLMSAGIHQCNMNLHELSARGPVQRG